MTYLKYADLCSTHVVNCLKEPAKSQALSKTAMHVRITPWENGKRLKTGAFAPVPLVHTGAARALSTTRWAPYSEGCTLAGLPRARVPPSACALQPAACSYASSLSLFSALQRLWRSWRLNPRPWRPAREADFVRG